MGKFVIKPSSDFSIVRIEITADVAEKRPNRYSFLLFRKLPSIYVFSYFPFGFEDMGSGCISS